MKNRSFLKEFLLFFIVGILINIFCVFLFYFPVNASGVSSSDLPYFVDNSQFSFGGFSVQDVQNFCNNKYGTVYTFDLVNKPTLFYTATGSNGVNYLVLWNSNSDNFKYYFSNYSVPLEHFETSTDHVSLTFTNVTRVQLYIDNQGNLHDYSWWNNQASTTLTFFGSYYYPVYISQNFNNNVLQANVYFESDTIILSKDRINGSPFPVGQGHATEPEFENNVVSGNHVLPHQVPTLTINNYTWTTAPSSDLSTLEKTMESIFDYLTWLGSNLMGSLNNLVSNIGGVGDYLGLTIQYYCGLIIKNIQDFNSNFYDNMVSLFEPIAETLSYFIEPLDTIAVQTALSHTSLYSLFTVGGSFKTTFQNYFDSIPQFDTLSFSIPYTILTSSGYVNFDFSWYSSIRNDVVPWIVGFLYAGFGLAVFRSIPSIIHGVSGVLQKGG